MSSFRVEKSKPLPKTDYTAELLELAAWRAAFPGKTPWGAGQDYIDALNKSGGFETSAVILESPVVLTAPKSKPKTKKAK